MMRKKCNTSESKYTIDGPGFFFPGCTLLFPPLAVSGEQLAATPSIYFSGAIMHMREHTPSFATHTVSSGGENFPPSCSNRQSQSTSPVPLRISESADDFSRKRKPNLLFFSSQNGTGREVSLPLQMVTAQLLICFCHNCDPKQLTQAPRHRGGEGRAPRPLPIAHDLGSRRRILRARRQNYLN